jgi:hypothetical protein
MQQDGWLFKAMGRRIAALPLPTGIETTLQAGEIRVKKKAGEQ